MSFALSVAIAASMTFSSGGFAQDEGAKAAQEDQVASPESLLRGQACVAPRGQQGGGAKQEEGDGHGSPGSNGIL